MAFSRCQMSILRFTSASDGKPCSCNVHFLHDLTAQDRCRVRRQNHDHRSGGGDGGLDAGINHIWLCVVSAGLNVDLFTMTPAVVSYGGVAAKIPGLIEAEEFDYGGEGVAYTDTSETNEGGVSESWYCEI